MLIRTLDRFSAIRLDFRTFLFNKWSQHSRIGLLVRVHFEPWMSPATFYWIALDLINKKADDTHSMTVPSGQRSHRIVLQCRHGRFSMTNIISQAVSAALYRVPADSHRSARTIVRPSTLTIARNRARFPPTKVQCFTLSRLKLW